MVVANQTGGGTAASSLPRRASNHANHLPPPAGRDRRGEVRDAAAEPVNTADLSASELRYRRLFEAAYDGILIVDPETRAIIDVNPYLSRLLGYPREELIGKELFQIGLLKDEAASQAAFRELQRSGYIRYDDLPLEAKDGRRADVEFVSNVYLEGNRSVIQCNVRDVTTRKRADDQRTALSLERARVTHEVFKARAASEHEKTSTDHFLAALSHELRTPLNPVLLLATAAAEDPTIPGTARAIFAEIVKNVEVEVRLIDDLQDISRITHGKMPLARESVDVHGSLRDAIKTVAGDLESKRIALRLNFRARGRFVLADRVRLQQIFWNVLRNAAKFSQPGGEIEVETTDLPTGMIRIKVADGGIGMTESELHHLFVAFSQGDHASASGSFRFGGMGLGLAIARMLVELHAGTIRAESAGPNRGSTFWIELPVYPPTLPEERSGPAPG